MPECRFYPNGYGISIIHIDTNCFAYGTAEAPYEIAVLQGNEEVSILCYDTPITDNVIGHLTRAEVEEIAQQVAELPKA